MYAVIKTGGKQYRVAADQKIQIEKLVGNPGDQVEFTSVLMVANGGSVDVGAPFVAGAPPWSARLPRRTAVRTSPSSRSAAASTIAAKNGHRQDLTSVTIREILVGGAKPAKKGRGCARGQG